MSDRIRTSQQSWCPFCHTPADPDCPDRAVSRRAAVKRERARVRRALSDRPTRDER